MVSTVAKRRRTFALALLCVAQFMTILDFSIVNIALPSIQQVLALSTANLQWVVSAYSLTFGGFLMLGGRMGDLYGRRKLFMIGIFLFLFASLAGGLAFSGILLIIARAIQGLGAALVAPAVLSLITTTFAEGEERNKAFGVMGSFASFGFAAGAMLGGMLTASLGWRWVLFVNVPIGCILLVLIPLFLTESHVYAERQRLDVPGAILVTVGIGVLVYALTQGNTFGWLSLPTLGLFALAIILLVAFVLVELRSSSPLVRLSIFRQRTVTGANLVNMLSPGAFGALVFILTLYMQEVLGYSAIEMGLAFLPIACIILISSNASARLVTRVGAKPFLLAGIMITALGLLLFMGLSATGNYVLTLLPGMLVVGLGMGIVFATVMIVATNGVSDEEQGLVSGLFNTTIQVGSGLILALVVALSTQQTGQLMQRGVEAKVALSSGFLIAIIACAVLDVVAVVVTVFVIRERVTNQRAAGVQSLEVNDGEGVSVLHAGDKQI